jgi:hypothetical protein
VSLNQPLHSLPAAPFSLSANSSAPVHPRPFIRTSSRASLSFASLSHGALFAYANLPRLS